MANTTNKFFDEVQALCNELQETIEAEVSGFTSNPADISARIKKVCCPEFGFRFFCQGYFPHYIPDDHAASNLHKYLFAELPKVAISKRGCKRAIAAPRGEAKSTIVTQLYILWLVVTDQTNYALIIMDALDQAVPMLEAIKAELAYNPRLLMDFPKQTGQGRVWKIGICITNNDVKLQAFGAQKKLRGLRHGPHRPDTVILDDIENDENIRKTEQRGKLEKWLNKAVLKLGPPDGSMNVIYIGTLLHYDSVLARCMKKPRWHDKVFQAIIKWPRNTDLWEKWEEIFINQGEDESDEYYAANKVAMDLDAVVSWPEVRPLLSLMKDKAEDLDAFMCEMQNDPSNSDNCKFKNLTFWVQQNDRWVFYGSLDPSLGKKKTRKGDPAAILIGGWDREKRVLDVVDSIIKKMLPTLIIATVITMQKQYKCVKWAVESVQFQEFLRQQLIDEGLKQGIYIPAYPVIPITDKDLRIESLEPAVSAEKIRFHPHHTTLNTQLTHYPEADHDDGPDALEMLWQQVVADTGGALDIRSGRARHRNFFKGYGHG